MILVLILKKIRLLASISLLLVSNSLWAVSAEVPLRSPINFSRSMMIEHSLKGIQFKYGEHTPLLLSIGGRRMEKTGRRVVLRVLQENNLVMEGGRFRLMYIDFKKPSEHTIDGEHFPAEMQFVHKNEIDGQMVVVVIFLRQNLRHPTDKHPMLSRLLHVMDGQDSRLDDIELMNLFPQDKSYFWYEGSLTVPPYSNNVTWIVYQQPIDVSLGQLDEQIAKRIDGDNNQDVVAPENQPVYRSISK